MKKNIFIILSLFIAISAILFFTWKENQKLFNEQQLLFGKENEHKIKLTADSFSQCIERQIKDISIIAQYDLKEYLQNKRPLKSLKDLFELYINKNEELIPSIMLYQGNQLKIQAGDSAEAINYSRKIHQDFPRQDQDTLFLPLIIHENIQFMPIIKNLPNNYQLIVIIDLGKISRKFLISLEESAEGSSFLLDQNGFIIFHQAKSSQIGKNIFQHIKNPELYQILSKAILHKPSGMDIFSNTSYHNPKQKIEKLIIWFTFGIAQHRFILGLTLPSTHSQQNIAAYSFYQNIILLTLLILLIILTYHFFILRNRRKDYAKVQQFQSEKERFELTLQGSRSGFWDWDMREDKIIISENWKRNLKNPQPQEKFSFLFLQQLIHPDDFPHFIDTLESHLQKETPYFEVEYRMKFQDGSYKWILDQGQALFDDTGNAFRFLGHQTDITQLKALEEELRANELRYRLTLAATQDGLWEWLWQSGKAYFSPHFYKMLGYRPDEFEANFENWKNLVHPDELQETLQSIESAVKNFEHFELVFRMRTKKDDWKWILARGKVVVWDEQGQPYKVMGTHTDYDKHKEIQQKLTEANQAKDRFFSIIAHDLKNPFNILVLSLETIREQYDHLNEQERKEMLESLSQSAYNTLNLLNNLLTWAKTQSDKIQFQPDYFLINPLINENIALLEAQAQEKQIQLVNNVQSKFTVFADYNMIHTVLRNLITNAIKFTRAQGKITVTAKETPQHKVQISITDTGVGIPKDRLTKLFALDSNYSTRGTNQEAGTGLGLILCREFIQKNCGEIWAESQIDQGSTFFFTLPLDPPQEV